MLRSLRPLLNVPVFRVLDGQNVQIVPNVLSVTVETCELSAPGADTTPLVRLETRGIGLGKELVMIRPRDLMRPRDHTTVLGLLESVYNMVKSGAILDEGVEVPLETTRKQVPQATMKVGVDGFDHLHSEEPLPAPPSDDEIDLWLSFYTHPTRANTLFCLLLPKSIYALRNQFQTPLRVTNLLFKYNNWNLLEPSSYREVGADILPTPQQRENSVLNSRQEANPTLLVPIPGVSISLKDGRVQLKIPETLTAGKTLAAIAELFSEGGKTLTLLASRHEVGVNGYACWDPQRELDSFVISTDAKEANINELASGESGEARSKTIGVTFVTFSTPEDAQAEGSLEMCEDGVAYCNKDSTEVIAALFAKQNIDTETFSLEWTDASEVSDPADTVFGDDNTAIPEGDKTVAELEKEIFGAEQEDEAEMEDWLSYITAGLQKDGASRKKNLSRATEGMVFEKTSEVVVPETPTPTPPTQTPTPSPKPVTASYKSTYTPPVQKEEADKNVEAPPQESSEEERTSVEPRMTNADFGTGQSNELAEVYFTPLPVELMKLRLSPSLQRDRRTPFVSPHRFYESQYCLHSGGLGGVFWEFVE